MSEYKWILLQNLNDGLSLIWLALLITTAVASLYFFADFERKESSITSRIKLKWLRIMMGTLFLLGTILVALPDKDQIALMRGEPVNNPYEGKSFFEKKVIIMPVE
jgi:hypothetical protein